MLSFVRSALRIYDLSLGQMLWSRRTVFMALIVGGPVFVGDRAVGSDRYHLQVAGGLAVVLPRGLDVFAEVAPGPERAVAFGVGFAPGR